MNEDTKDTVLEAVRLKVWSGFYSASAIHEAVTEYLFQPGDVDEAWLNAQITEEFARKADDEKTWPDVTECDLLDRTFRELNATGTIALQNAGYEQSDGIEDVTQVYYDQGESESSITGYCFYHGQDLERAVQGRGLMLTFGDINGADDKGIEIGRRIVAAFEHEGFTVKWPGTIHERIEVPQIQWQRRSPR